MYRRRCLNEEYFHADENTTGFENYETRGIRISVKCMNCHTIRFLYQKCTICLGIMALIFKVKEIIPFEVHDDAVDGLWNQLLSVPNFALMEEQNSWKY